MAFIKEYKNVLSKSLCDEIIQKFEEDEDRRPGELGGNNVNLNFKKTTDVTLSRKKIEKDKHWQTLETKINNCIGIYVKKYLYEHVGGEILGRKLTDKNFVNSLGIHFKDGVIISRLLIQKYTPGGYFKPHSDDSPYVKNLLAIIIYLNDVNSNIDGGSTRFYNGREIKPETGKMLIFPSTWTYIHQGTELKRGVKYIISTFGLSNYKCNTS